MPKVGPEYQEGGGGEGGGGTTSYEEVPRQQAESGGSWQEKAGEIADGIVDALIPDWLQNTNDYLNEQSEKLDASGEESPLQSVGDGLEKFFGGAAVGLAGWGVANVVGAGVAVFLVYSYRKQIAKWLS